VHALSLPRVQLGPTAAFALVASIIGLALFASAVPSPLYGVYQAEWHFSTLVLTLVYGIYCFGVLAALLLVGRISDDIGRRPVLAVALVGLIGAAVLFSLADSVGWLFAARGLQGLMTGLALGAAGAALLDLHPRHDGQHAGLINGVVSATGIGAGALVTSVLLEYAPDPLVLPFLVLLGLIVVALLGTLALPEPVTRSARLALRPQRPRVPVAIRGPFVLSGLGVLSSWSIGGLYLALGPRLAGDLLDTTNHLAGGAAVLALCVPGALTQLLWQGLDARRAASIGSGVLALGMALTAASLSTSSAVLFLGATAITGGGFGLAFLGALRSLTAVIPADQRAEVMSAFYVVAYLSISMPAIAAGVVVPDLGLEATFRVFSVAVVVVALVVTVAAARTARPRARSAAAAEPAG
jgi:predicted MFS family arabinose efflux permease